MNRLDNTTTTSSKYEDDGMDEQPGSTIAEKLFSDSSSEIILFQNKYNNFTGEGGVILV